MRLFIQALVGIAVAVFLAYVVAFVWPPAPAYNPDPNHTHADFAVWIGGKQMDFSKPEFMSNELTSAEEEALKNPKADAVAHDPSALRKYLHLHDGNGHVIHRHKPGLGVGDFFWSLGIDSTHDCMTKPRRTCLDAGLGLRLFVNEKELPYVDNDVFADDDRILLTDSADPVEVQRELSLMTGDACRYSKTCPWKGAPPTENCIADPEVPCKE